MRSFHLIFLFLLLNLQVFYWKGFYRSLVSSSDPADWRQCLENGDKWCRDTSDDLTGEWCSSGSSSSSCTSSDNNTCSTDSKIDDESKIALCPYSFSDWDGFISGFKKLGDTKKIVNKTYDSDTLCLYSFFIKDEESNGVNIDAVS